MATTAQMSLPATMSEPDILTAMDDIASAAKKRMEESSPTVRECLGGSALEYMTPDERTLHHELQMAWSANYGHLHTAAAAHQRVLDRIRERREKRNA